MGNIRSAKGRRLHPWAKYRRAVGLTQLDVADLLGVTRHYVIRLEQSLYWHPTDSLLARLSLKYGVDLDEFKMSYYDYVRSKRDLFKVTHVDFDSGLAEPYLDAKHPLVAYRESYGLSRMGLCKALCLHYDNISDYENNQQRHCPDQLVVACEEMDWDVEPLVQAVSEWRESGHADRLRRRRTNA